MNALVPSFSNPVLDAQAFFRKLLTAMSSPAKPFLLPHLPQQPDPASPFSAGMAATALTLCDSQSAIWLQPEADTPTVRHYLRFYCGAVFAQSLQEARFAFIACPQTMPRLSAFAQGTAQYPEQSTTLVLAASFAGSGQPLLAKGPGIGGEQGATRRFTCGALPEWFWADWMENHKAFPLGVDMLLLDEQAEHGAALMAFPRTSAVLSATKAGQE